jgi:tetratricopeptide (TPR) repeat protein
MKKLILLLLIILTSCNDAQEKENRIPWTSTSEEAKILFEEFLTNIEISNWDPQEQEALFDSIAKLDPSFFVPKLFNNFKDADERRALVRLAYENKNKVSDLESRFIEANYERRINGSIVRQDQIIDSLILDYPQFHQLHIWSGDIKNSLNVKESEKRWEEALVINPNSFEAYVNLAFLHFPTGNNFNMLATDERNLEKAETLLNKAKDILPESSRPPRFLGNVYRAQGEFNKSLAAYKESLQIIDKYESGNKSDPYANSLLMVGHVYTFQEKYDEARKFYDEAISISNEYWKVSVSELKSHTYMYQKDFGGAISILSETQDQIQNFDIDTIQKTNYTIWMEFAKFLAFGHSQKQEETIGSVKKIQELRTNRSKIFLADAINEIEMERIKTNLSISNMELDIWYNILFGNYDEARNQISEFKTMSEKQLEFDPNSLNNYHKFSGYLNLMEGNPQESIDAYSNLSKGEMTGDSYHYYFLALAKKAVGREEESKQAMVALANDNFATWQNSIIKNLAKSQIKTNL